MGDLPEAGQMVASLTAAVLLLAVSAWPQLHAVALVASSRVALRFLGVLFLTPGVAVVP